MTSNFFAWCKPLQSLSNCNFFGVLYRISFFKIKGKHPIKKINEALLKQDNSNFCFAQVSKWCYLTSEDPQVSQKLSILSSKFYLTIEDIRISFIFIYLLVYLFCSQWWFIGELAKVQWRSQVVIRYLSCSSYYMYLLCFSHFI